MRSRRSRLALVGALVLAGTLLLSGAAEAKKHKKLAPADVRNTVVRPIPDALAAPPNTYGELDTGLPVGKRYKGKKVDDLSVTFKTTGSDPTSASDLFFALSAPNGRSVVIGPKLGGQSIGPLTVVENSPVTTCELAPCAYPWARLNQPYAGTIGVVELAQLNGVPMRGNWTFTAWDFNNTHTSTLDSVELRIAPLKGVLEGR